MNLPNFLSLARALTIPLFIIFFEESFAVWIFTAAVITDMLDGAIARLFNMKTTLGSILDPLADKMLLIIAFIMLTRTDAIPMWFTVIVISRDVMIVVGWFIIYLVGSHMVLSSTFLSKLTTILQSTTIILYLMRLPKEYSPLVEQYAYMMLALTIVSGIDYVIKGSRQLANLQKTNL